MPGVMAATAPAPEVIRRSDEACPFAHARHGKLRCRIVHTHPESPPRPAASLARARGRDATARYVRCLDVGDEAAGFVVRAAYARAIVGLRARHRGLHPQVLTLGTGRRGIRACRLGIRGWQDALCTHIAKESCHGAGVLQARSGGSKTRNRAFSVRVVGGPTLTVPLSEFASWETLRQRAGTSTSWPMLRMASRGA
jgi:hypothetical protein